MILDLLLIQSLDLSELMEQYRQFCLGILPGIFMIAAIVEYFDQLDPFSLAKRAIISVLILSCVGTVYEKSIAASMKTADEILRVQKNKNPLLADMLERRRIVRQWNSQSIKKHFSKNTNTFTGTLGFLTRHLFSIAINDTFTLSVLFMTKLCFVLLKVVYSLVYYLGLGLIGIPCLLFLFPSMGNVLRGALMSFVWCLIVPHILVFILSLLGAEIAKGYSSGQIIGGSIMGTALLFVLALLTAFVPMIAAFILSGSGISQAGGIIGAMGANYIINLPKNVVNHSATLFRTGLIRSQNPPRARTSYRSGRGGIRRFKGARRNEH